LNWIDEEAPMITPHVTELPLRMEPMTADSFLGGEAAEAPALRELDHRHNHGIDVRLLWDECTGQVTVAVSDAKTGDEFEIAVEGHEAREAFHHPYAHAASRGIAYASAVTQT
jgi:hypothetical protein